MRVDVLTEGAALAAIEPEWWDLFRRIPTATPFASPAWLVPWWQSFAPGDLFTVALRLGDRLVGLAPMYTERGAQGPRLLPLGIGLTDALDLLVDPEHAEAVGIALGCTLGAEQARWACWSAEEAPPGAAVLSIDNPAGWSSEVTPQSACPVLSLPTSGVWREAIPARKWRKWSMAQNRAARRTWSLELTTAATLREAGEHLIRLHGTRWADRGQAGVLADAVVQQFHAAALPALLAANLLRMTTLRIDGIVAGVFYGLQHGSAAYAYLGGFDPAFAFESPGTLLIGSAIATAAAEGVTSFNFLRGQEPYKYEWGAVDRWNQCRAFRPNP